MSLESASSAISRWTDDGGAVLDRHPPRGDVSGWSASDRAIVERLGIAVLEEWEALPMRVQRTLFRRAAGDVFGGDEMSAQIARFLHDKSRRS
jgi:hypothetical protein